MELGTVLSMAYNIRVITGMATCVATQLELLIRSMLCSSSLCTGTQCACTEHTDSDSVHAMHCVVIKQSNTVTVFMKQNHDGDSRILYTPVRVRIKALRQSMRFPPTSGS